MTLFVAAAWSFAARLGLDLLRVVLLAVQPLARVDAVTSVLCQAAAFLGTLHLLLRAHERDRPLTDSLALRPTAVSLCVIGTALGLTLHAPVDRLADLILQRFPLPPEDIAAQTEAFSAVAWVHRTAIVATAGVLGPFVEEVFFRGGLFRSLRRAHTQRTTVAATALLFACSHLSLHAFLPVFGIGLVLSHLRAASGSLLPGLLLHVAFNLNSIVDNWREQSQGLALHAPPTLPISLGALAVSLALLGAYQGLARRCPACGASRDADAC
jgi:CAAX protease family protein